MNYSLTLSAGKEKAKQVAGEQPPCCCRIEFQEPESRSAIQLL